MLNKLFPSLAIATVIAVPIIALTAQISTAFPIPINVIIPVGGSNGNNSQNNNSNNSVSSDNKTLLMQAGLQPAECIAGANIIVVYMPNGKQACAFATGAYPAGQAYRMNPNDFSINPVGGRTGYIQPPSSGYIQPPSSGYIQPPSSGYIQPPSSGYIQPPPSGYIQPPPSGYIQPPPPVYPTQMQTVMVTYNPSQPVPQPAYVRINAALTSQGLQPAACGTGVVVINFNNTYTACAYPTANFPAGNYSLNIPGL